MATLTAELPVDYTRCRTSCWLPLLQNPTTIFLIFFTFRRSSLFVLVCILNFCLFLSPLFNYKFLALTHIPFFWRLDHSLQHSGQSYLCDVVGQYDSQPPVSQFTNLACRHFVGPFWLLMGLSQGLCLLSAIQTQKRDASIRANQESDSKRYKIIHALDCVGFAISSLYRSPTAVSKLCGYPAVLWIRVTALGPAPFVQNEPVMYYSGRQVALR